MTTTKKIQDRAMTMELRISAWTARKHDKKISNEVAETHGAGGTADDVGRYNKILITREALKEIGRLKSRARHTHYHYTLPWHDEGPRLLSTRLYLEYSETMSKLKEDFEAEVAKFVAAYPTLIEDARKRLNGMFDAADYPHPSRIASRFAFDTEVGMLPSSGDLRLDISDEHLENVRAEIEKRVQSRFADATKEVWQRIHAAVSHIKSRMDEYDPEAKGRLHESTLGNLRELVAVLPALNIADDAALERMRVKLEKELCPLQIEPLRDDARARAAVSKKAAALLDVLAPHS